MTPQEYFNQVFELEKELDVRKKKRAPNPHPFCNINAKKISRILELSQEINELMDKRANLRLKYGHQEGYGC